MSAPILTTKLYIPPPRPRVVRRPRLVERLNDGLRQGRKLTLLSAPAGFGKSSLLSEWLSGEDGAIPPLPAAWLSLDEQDSDPARLLAYLVAALRTINADIGAVMLAGLQSPQPLPMDALLAVLLNDIATVVHDFILVLDDFHVVDVSGSAGASALADPDLAVGTGASTDQALAFLIERAPPQMHLVIATREDPQLPLARMRARGQLTELRAADLRFTPAEAAEFLNGAMGLYLTAGDIAALESRTEGWIAGLQLAALALQGLPATPGHEDASSFITSFTGSHHYVMDYLIEEVLQQQPASIQTFLLRTSILDRLCEPLCDAVCSCDGLGQEAGGQSILEHLERANLFIVPLDSERRWYRYHHLFAELLRQRLRQHLAATMESGDAESGVVELHLRASTWYEENGMEIEAFYHAVTANDIDRAARLVEGRSATGTRVLPLSFRGAVTPVLHWLASLPASTLDARPALWVMYASVVSMTGQLDAVEPKLLAAERALEHVEPDDESRNLIGHIAAIRALLAAAQNHVETIISQSQRALEYLHPDNMAVRTATIWKLGIAYQLQGDRSAAARSFAEAVSIGQASGNLIINMAASTGLAHVQETQNRLPLAAETYRRVLELPGDPEHPASGEAHLGLARICYEWNDLPGAEQHAQQCLRLMHQYGDADGRSILGEVVLARVRLAQGDATGAAALLARLDHSARRQNAVQAVPDVAAAQVQSLLRLGDLATAAATARDFPLSRARVLLAQGDAAGALAAIEPLRRRAEAMSWEDERLRVMLLQALAFHAAGRKDQTEQRIGEALTLAEPAGRIRIFVDEGQQMARLLSEPAVRKIAPDYVDKLLAAFGAEREKTVDEVGVTPSQPLIEPLSERELDILRLIAQGLSNRQIAERLFLALDTIKGYNRKIFEKLQVNRRTEAVALARELGLL